MNVLSLGVDCSTTQTALVVIDHNGFHALRRVIHDTKEQGARRLMQIRAAVGGALDCARWDLHVATVEVPVNVHRSFALESCAAVVLEVIQQRYPHLIVLDPTPRQWQAFVFDTAVRGKHQALEHASAHGLDTDDDNLADALCLAEYGRELYIRDVLNRRAA